jgi:hypothetical protein
LKIKNLHLARKIRGDLHFSYEVLQVDFDSMTPADWDTLLPTLPQFPLFPKKERQRACRLTDAAREALRQRILRTQPWKKSTGPKTELGKIIVSQNALKHGFYARDAGVAGRAYRAAYRQSYRLERGCK